MTSSERCLIWHQIVGLILAQVSSAFSPTLSYEYRANIRRVVDGDTVDADIDLGFNVWPRNERLRLYKIDAPETRGASRLALLQQMHPLRKLKTSVSPSVR